MCRVSPDFSGKAARSWRQDASWTCLFIISFPTNSPGLRPRQSADFRRATPPVQVDILLLGILCMDHKIFQYGLIKGTRGFSSLNDDNFAYLTRNGTIGSVRNDDGRFLAVLQSQLHRFDIEKQHIQHISTKSGFEVYIQFSSWRRFVELSWEGDSYRATAELPKRLKNVNVQLRKERYAGDFEASGIPWSFVLQD
ncbi:hypothetical protein DER44DRAFT_192716 [Fusarium oxysporum]|nr:hypothetical protein DER44DRAFT_192716 [Fusarium oxysporum]